MAPKKLSDFDKQDILNLYRQPEETTSTLANRYGVSNTTISRVLKQSLPDQEYEALIQQKRSGTVKSQFDEVPAEAPPIVDDDPAFIPTDEPDEPDEPAQPEAPAPISERRQRRRSAAASEPVTVPVVESLQEDPLPPLESSLVVDLELSPVVDNLDLDLHNPAEAEGSVLKEILAQDVLKPEEDFVGLEEDGENELDDLEDDLDDLEDDLDDEGLEDDLDDISDTAVDEADLVAIHVRGETFVKVLPLSEALIPKICYLVVDRASELITRPLRDFADLGQIPAEEIQERTLPVFDNHRVARRFSRRMQRVVKVPDGRLLQKVSPYLQAKGITRLLIDGRVYSL